MERSDLRCARGQMSEGLECAWKSGAARPCNASAVSGV